MSKRNKDKMEEKIGSDTVTETFGEPVSTKATAAIEKAKVASKLRGPRGVAEDTVISLKATANPKRAGSKAFTAFSNYRDGMTVKEFADALDADPMLKGTSTGHLVYDAKHGFISIDGYDPGQIVVPKPRAPAKEKAPKAVKGQGQPSEGEVQAQAEADAEKME